MQSGGGVGGVKNHVLPNYYNLLIDCSSEIERKIMKPMIVPVLWYNHWVNNFHQEDKQGYQDSTLPDTLRLNWFLAPSSVDFSGLVKVYANNAMAGIHPTW